MKGYKPNEIQAAIAAKGFNRNKLAKELGRSPTSVNKAIRGESTIRSEKLEDEIIAYLQPELDLISKALKGSA
jgi:ribosome-binding protein aMBF1 (putative translation factor)